MTIKWQTTNYGAPKAARPTSTFYCRGRRPRRPALFFIFYFLRNGRSLTASVTFAQAIRAQKPRAYIAGRTAGVLFSVGVVPPGIIIMIRFVFD